jgi:hypothetical protein
MLSHNNHSCDIDERSAIQKLHSVADSVEGVKPTPAWDLVGVGPNNFKSCSEKLACSGIDVDDKRWVCLLRRPEVFLDADVKLAIGSADSRNPEPTSPAPLEQRWFRQFSPSQRGAVERTLRPLAIRGTGDQHMMDHPVDLMTSHVESWRSVHSRRDARSVAGTDPLISNVSDTARWVPTYRATESARPDALFHDPLAERLAGERGSAIVASAPRTIRNGWWLVARTKVIDDVIIEAIGDGCDRVLNLAAGLDTRPYRLDLPPDSRGLRLTCRRCSPKRRNCLSMRHRDAG